MCVCVCVCMCVYVCVLHRCDWCTEVGQREYYHCICNLSTDYILYSVHCTLYTIHYILYSVHCSWCSR